ncbi:probable peptidoglycan muropeptide transporter SLC46 isoform X2 [Onthophagus taurus]|nr:proton-coupled folate transporter [Onthophagus taurus]
MTEETWTTKMKEYLQLITVEPTMIFYMMAFMITSIVEQAFFVHKACTVNHGFNETVCDNLVEDQYKELNKEVQLTVSEFHQWNDIAGHLGQIILAFFMGAWADRRGRKLPLTLGLIGKFYYSTMIIVNSQQKDWPVEYIIYTATIPMTITGADVAIFAAAFTYITDVSSPENRTLRVTILEVCYLATMPTGIALGKVLYSNVTNKSYSIMFTINASLLFIGIIYTLLRLKWRTNEKQRPLSEANNIFTDFFDLNHVVQTFQTILKKRRNRKRTYLFLLIFAMAFYTFQRDEKPMMYLYVQLVLKWGFDQFSNFKTYVSALQDVFLLCAIPLMSKYFGWRDTYIMLFGALCHLIARIFYATAQVGWLLYIGGAFAAFGPVVAPVIRSIVSKMISSDERGKIFSILAVADNAIPIVSGTLYSQVYNASIHTHPAAIYYLTIGTQVMVFLAALYIHFTTTNEDLIHDETDVIESCIENDDNTTTQEKD